MKSMPPKSWPASRWFTKPIHSHHAHGHTSDHHSARPRCATRQRGSILLKFTGLVLVLTVALVAGGIFYLGSADLPAPTATVKIPLSKSAIQPQ
ncbi:MAG: hypothetical protein AAF213_04045 [Pseudomonadota bacterium]